MFQPLILDKHLYSSDAQSCNDLRTDTVKTCVKKRIYYTSTFVYTFDATENRRTAKRSINEKENLHII